MTSLAALRSSLHLQVLALGVAQTVAWASSAYLPAIVARPAAAELGISPTTVFAAYSGALAVMALLGPAVGRAIDRRGGRGVLCLSNLVLAAGLLLLANSSGLGMMLCAWAVIGAGMALGLYDAAFATLVRLHGVAVRGPMTGVTLLGGFASTLGWPLSSFLITTWDWRAACLTWAIVNGVLALPLNFLFVPAAGKDEHGKTPASSLAAPPDPPRESAAQGRNPSGAMLLLALFGAATAFVTSAMAAHLPGFLAAAGVGATAAIAAAALVGPAQVLARVFEYAAARRFRLHPLVTARVATALHPAGAFGLLALGGTPAVAAYFAVLHGAGNGMITIAKGMLPLALFGTQAYGLRLGALAVAQRAMQALAPYAFAVVLEWGGAAAAIALTATLSVLALAALLGLEGGDGVSGQMEAR